jgi:hypothetical protein
LRHQVGFSPTFDADEASDWKRQMVIFLPHQVKLIFRRKPSHMNMSGMTLKILHQDAIKATVDNWPCSSQLIAYKYLKALGCKLDGIDYEIDKEIKRDLEQGRIDLKHR